MFKAVTLECLLVVESVFLGSAQSRRYLIPGERVEKSSPTGPAAQWVPVSNSGLLDLRHVIFLSNLKCLTGSA